MCDSPADKPRWFNVVRQIYGCIPHANPSFRIDISHAYCTTRFV